MLNLANLKTPGVYIDEVSQFPPSIAAVETAIPAFIGNTQNALKNGESVRNKPVRITSMVEYREIFGEPQNESNIIVNLDSIEDASGRKLKEIVSAEFDAASGGPSPYLMFYTLHAFYSNGGGPCWVLSVGGYSDTINRANLEAGLSEIRRIDEVTLLHFPDAINMPSGQADYYGLQEQAIKQCVDLQDRFSVFDVFQEFRDLKSNELNDIATNFRGAALPSEVDNTKYAAVYFPIVKMSFDYAYQEADMRVRKRVNGQGGNFENFSSLNGQDKAKAKAAIQAFPVMLPASAAVLGVYARVDNLRGVWKAPANETIFGCQNLTYRMNDEEQSGFNVDVNAGKSINVIRYFTGKGFKIWGARTLAGNDNEWRYISVRRFFNMVEESAKKATYQFVFEPNDINTWVKVKAMIENFLVLQWRAGALQGVTPEKAFFVRVGLGETMTALDILEGRMIVEIGMAVVRPAEFIILRFSHKLPEA